MFYLCNNIQNVSTLFNSLGVKKIDNICFLYKNNIIQINFTNDEIIINTDNKYNIFLGDISINTLDHILEIE